MEAKERERKAIERQVAEFLAKGGKINKVDETKRHPHQWNTVS